MATQSTYSATQRPGLPGHVADQRAAVMRSVTVEAVGGLGFGLPVFQGTLDEAGRVKINADTITDFLGVSVRDRSVMEGDGYKQYESARVMQTGPIWVTAAVQVAAGDPVAVTSAGVWSNVAGTDGLVIPDARWDTSTVGTNKLARIHIK